MSTTLIKPQTVTRSWHLIDLSSAPLGRLTTQISRLLMGKHKTTYTPHVDCGDYVVVINTKAVVVTGNKRADKMYRHHSGIPGGFREYTFEEVYQKDPKKILVHAVSGMLPKNKLRAPRLKRLKIYLDDKHPFAKQLTTKEN